MIKLGCRDIFVATLKLCSSFERIRSAITKGAASGRSLLLLSLSLLSVSVPSVATGAEAGQWLDVSEPVTANISNPIRSRRSPDATLKVSLTNITASPMAGPIRLVLSGLTEGVTLNGVAGSPNVVLVPEGQTLAAGASTSETSLTISKGGKINFSFQPKVEQFKATTGEVDPEVDSDGDGVPDLSDAFPQDPSRSKLPVVTIASPATLTTVGHTPIQVNGSVDQNVVALTLNGVAVSYEDGLFNAQVALKEGHNSVVARMVDVTGIVSTASVNISLDLTPPYLTLESHKDGQTVYTDKITVTGLINDIVRGTIESEQASVTVNGVAAEISNRSYRVSNVALVEGENLIRVIGVDQVGNENTEEFSLVYKKLSGKKLELVSGQNQTAAITAELADPLVIKVLDENALPVEGKAVVFRVAQGSGVVGVGSVTEGRGYLATTDANGLAQTRFRLGQRAGTGNHKVSAHVVGYEDNITFSASATANIGDKLSVNSGNNQRAGLHQPLPAPFVAVVTDSGANTVKGARVRFEVSQGGGRFQNDADELTILTDSDGRASAHLTLGGLEGLDQQVVRATLLDAPVVDGVTQIISAGFTASGLVAGEPAQTTISGVVLDNQDNPLPGVTIRVDGTTRQAIADAAGQFIITQAPVGPVHLVADGSTATVEGEYPALSYNIVTVSGADNPLSAPIYMVKLDTENGLWLDEKTGGQLTIAEVPGFKLDVAAGSVTFPDGSKEGQLSVTVVNSSKIPMAPPNGMQPQFIVTIQPAGAMFDPPAQLTLPNVDGHTPGAQVEMFSFDHDLEEFVAIGLGTVSEDSTVIESNTGVGVIKAGWHCGAQPGGSGCCGGGGGGGDGCGKCKKKAPGADKCDPSGKNCVNDDKRLQDCKACSGGSEVNTGDIENPDSKENICKTCQDGSKVADPGKEGKGCGKGDKEACFTCKDGSCGNNCEGAWEESLKISYGGPLAEGARKISRRINAVSLDFEASAEKTWGAECCKDCSQKEPQDFESIKVSGSIAGSAEVTYGASLPAVNQRILQGYYFRMIFQAQLFAKLEAKGGGDATEKTSACEDADCDGGGSLNATISVTGGARGNVSGGMFKYKREQVPGFKRCVGLDPRSEERLLNSEHLHCWEPTQGVTGSVTGSITGGGGAAYGMDGCGNDKSCSLHFTGVHGQVVVVAKAKIGWASASYNWSSPKWQIVAPAKGSCL